MSKVRVFELNPENLIGVLLPIESDNIRCHTKFNQITYLIGTEAFTIKLPKNNEYHRVGLVDNYGKLDFNPEEIVERLDNQNSYKDYIIPEESHFCEYYLQTAEESFQTLLDLNKVDIPEDKKLLILKKV